MKDSKDLVTERRGGGTTTRSRYKMTPSATLSESRYVQNAAISYIRREVCHPREGSQNKMM